MHSQESEILILLSDLFEYAILLLPLYVSLSLGIYKLSTKKGLPFPMLSWIPGVQLYNLFAFIGKIRESLFLITSICGIGFIVFLASSNSPIDLGLLRLIILPIGLLIPLFLFRLITINIQSLLQKVGHSGVFWWCMLILFLPFTLLYF